MRGGQGKLFSVLFLLFWQVANAQEVQIKGGFVEDSLVIGQEVDYWITASYPPSMEIIFPDTNSSFSPFEFAGKTYFQTEMRNNAVFDSTVYTLQSFEIDPVQFFQLSAIALSKEDSATLKSPLDSIYLTELAPTVSDSTRLKTNLDYQEVARQFNYPLMYYIIGGLAVIAILILAIFGSRIIKFFKIRRLERDFKSFAERFDEHINSLKESPDPAIAEKALSIWKKYQQRLEKIAFSSFTTTDILELEFTKELTDPLKSIDRVVYGRKMQEKVYQDFQQIEDFTNDRFQRKIAEIRNGK